MTRSQAQETIARLILNHGTNSALARVRNEGRFSKQSDREVAMRAAGNLLNSFVLHKGDTVNTVVF